MKKAIIIIPTYNERENIGNLLPVLTELFTRIHGWKMQVLVVDDNSPDGTADVVRAYAKKNSDVHLQVNADKGGLGKAYLVGMTKAFDDLGADVVFEMDADFQHDPEKIPLFLQAIDAGAEMVVGSRYIKGGSIPSHWKLQRKFYSIVGNWINMVVFSHFAIHDWTGGFRAIVKPVFEAIRDDLTDPRLSGYTFQIGTLHKVLRKGFRIVEVPFHFRDRTAGESKLGPDYIKYALQYILTARLDEITHSRVFRFAIVGGIGACVQLTMLQVLRRFFPYELAFFLAIEIAVASNFTLSNLWTFADRALGINDIPLKFLQFNLASAGSILVQQLLAVIGKRTIGLFTLFVLPIIHYRVDTGLLFAVVGILVGMIWNYLAYSRIVWKSHATS